MQSDLQIKMCSLLTAKEVFRLNEQIFNEMRLINHLEHKDLWIYLATLNEIPVGFKVGYAITKKKYYSAKGGVLPAFRRQGIAEKLMYRMMFDCKNNGYRLLCFDTMPDLFPGMYQMGLKLGFKVVSTVWEERYQAQKMGMCISLNVESSV